MNRFLTAVLMLSLVLASAVGCSDKTKATKKKNVSTPGGETSTSTTKATKKSGDYPAQK